MNKILVIVVIVLLPFALMTEKNESLEVVKGDTLEKISLEIPLVNSEVLEPNKSEEQVLISNNKDKSSPYYVDLEEYIIGVVAGEMPASFNMEALKAQAIASRTYALYKMKNINGYVLSTNINDQVYLSVEQMKKKWGVDFDVYYEKVKKAVMETKGQVLTYNDDIIIAYYFAISNGYTDDAQVVFKENRDYLVSVPSLWDKNYKAYSSTRKISKNTFCEKLNISSLNLTIGKVVRSESNYVREIEINGKKFTGLEVFNKLGLKSTDFTITVSGDVVTIETFGFGHGVGMSQYGAQGMATDGYSFQDILAHYYTNTKISNI